MRARHIRWMAVTCIFLILLSGAAHAVSVTEKTKHFEISYADSQVMTAYIDPGDTLEKSYKEINGYLGTCPDHVKVLIVGKKAMDQVGEHVEAFSAWNKQSSSIVLREESLKNQKSLAVVTKHEICHLGLNNILAIKKDQKDFSWLEEGMCMVLSKEPFSDAKVSKYIMGKGFMNTKEIAAAVDSENYNISKNGYMQSYSLFKYMMARYGIEKIVEMCKSPDTNFAVAFRRYTGDDFQSFYNEWKANVAETALYGQSISMPGYGYLNFDQTNDGIDCLA